MNNEENNAVKPTVEKYLLGKVKWYDKRKGFGYIKADKTDYYINRLNLLSTISISENNLVIFCAKSHNGKLSAINCQLFPDGLNDCSSDNQIELLQVYLSKFRYIESSGYATIKSIIQSKKINETTKVTFLKLAFEKASADCQYKMLFEDHLIVIENETTESQIELLQKIERLDINQIKSIAQSNRIKEDTKVIFLKSAFKKASTDCQYKMLFEDCLIDIENETTEIQIDILQKLGKLDINQIKFISQSNKISEAVKVSFLKTTFGHSNTELQYKMLIMGLTTISTQEQQDFLNKYLLELGEIEKDFDLNVSNKDWRYDKIKSISQSDKINETVKAIFLESAFEKASTEYQYKMLVDGLIFFSEECQINFLNNYLLRLDNISQLNYDQVKSFAKSAKIANTAKESFLKSVFKKANIEYQYEMLVDGLINLSEETQIEFLHKYLLELGNISGKYQSDKIDEAGNLTFGKYRGQSLMKVLINEPSYVQWCLANVTGFNISAWKYNRVKFIVLSDKIAQTAKEIFIKSAYKKASVEYQFKMLFEDCLINIEKVTTESQIELLQKIKKLDINQIKSIAQSKKINEITKVTFLKLAFEKASADCQYKMLFEDHLIDIENETTESQIELLQKIEKLDINQIKSIAQSNRIKEDTKVIFLKSAFKKASTDCQYKMLFEDCLIDIESETTEIQNDILQKLGKLDINQIKFISQSDKIEKKAKVIFLKSVFEKASVEYQCKMIVDELIIFSHEEQQEFLRDYKWLSCVKQYSPKLYDKLFEDNYSQLTKIDRLYLWLQGLNPYYNYLEFVQAAWQLSNDERKLFNKRVKEHAREERWQKFIDQVPTAKLIEETENTKIYNCKWRNLYYFNGAICVFLDKTTATENYTWNPSCEEWNLLTQEYFNNRRIDDIIVTVDSNNRITKITGLEDIEAEIIMAEVRKNGTSERRTEISSSQLAKIIHNVASRVQCIDFLTSRKSDYNVIDIQELITDNYGSLQREISFLFPIPDENDNVYLIWESAEFEKSKATHIFKSDRNVFEELESKIKDFIESNIRTRSRLNSVEIEDLKVKRELQYFCKVNHDMADYQVWENRIKGVLPFLK